MSKYICVEDFANELKNFACKQCKENKEDAEGWKCGSCSVMYLVGAVDAFSSADVEPVIHAADVAPKTDLGVLATARAIELLAASMEFLRNMDAIVGSERYMSVLCEYDDTLNDGYCLLRDIEDFFEIVEDEE